jgi:hypothetical protein
LSGRRSHWEWLGGYVRRRPLCISNGVLPLQESTPFPSIPQLTSESVCNTFAKSIHTVHWQHALFTTGIAWSKHSNLPNLILLKTNVTRLGRYLFRVPSAILHLMHKTSICR